ncbi:MAG: UDP-N-acetylmuramate:L-alanyl-gamma-D-glutamyl-meso-diaminopimelate ligase [Deltaproteobacteria bacterium]|nr:MAG: UDP-N-acetylmuramate:L-alanyl-gamma-D-glutamyl-meso-diaminopimelate ligase [Deltaproteobacteria bacterium]
MDLSKNCIPDDVKQIHLIAVCGSGMGALACMLKDLGHIVTGSDQRVYPPMSTFLTDKNITILNGFEESHLLYRPDLVVVGNAVTKDNPEVVATHKLGLNFCSMPQALNRFVVAGKKPLLIAGTHGKTTTASILAWILDVAGFDPSFVIGGILKNFGSSYHLGKGQFIVIEADEYDTAFFDKGPKFLHYKGVASILTSVEFDHADIYEDLNHVKSAFGRFISAIAGGSLLVAYDSDETIDSLLDGCKGRIEKYGRQLTSPWQLGNIIPDPPWTFFEIFNQGEPFGNFKSRLMGEHNLLNALAAVAVADYLNIPVDILAEALASFENVKRRQEVRGQKSGVTVMDDFAHHPTAVRETLTAVKPFHAGGRIIAVFEPRTNTSMRDVFQDVYPLCFDPADLICIRKPPLLGKIPPDHRFSSEKLVQDLKKRGKIAHYFSDTAAIIDFLVQEAKSGDLILIMSNGGFDNIHERLLEKL